MSGIKTVREVFKSPLHLKKRTNPLLSPWVPRTVTLLCEISGQAGTEKYILQVSKGSKTITIAASNIISIESFDEELLMTLILPNNKEMNFKADSLQKLIQWVSSLKVAIGKGTLFHVKHRRGDTEEDEDSLMYFIDVSNEGAGNSDQVLVLSSPINDITRQAWKVSQIRQFRITDLGVCIEFCPNCYRTHMPQYRSFNLFVRSSMINACIDFLCKKTKAVALKESTETFVTIYKLQNHKCPSITPPNTPPPQVPPKAPNVKPPMPPRTHPRLGCLNAPPAEPYLPPYSRMNPVKGWDDLVCPYKITNKIVVNNDGTVSYVSTVLGHSGSKTDLRPSITPQRGHRKPIQQEQQKPHQLTKRQMPSTNPHAKKQQLHKTESTAVPPRNIRRPAIMSPVMSPSLDSTDYPEEDYENQWPSEEFKRSVSSQEPEIMVSSPVKRKPLSYLEPVSTTLPIDDDKIGDDKDYVNADQIEFLASLKPPEKSMSPSSETSDDSDTGCKDYVNVPDVVSPDYMNIPDILLKMPVEEQNVTPLKVVRPTIKARTLPTATSESHKQESPTPNKRYTTNPPPVVDRTGQRAKSPAVSKHQQYQAESPAVSKHQQYQAETTKSPAVSKHQQYQAESPAVSKHQQYQAESPAVSKHQQYQAETTKSPAVSKHQQYQTETTKSPAVSKHQQYQAESPAVSKHQQYQTETTKSPAVSKHQQYQTETAKSPAVSKHQQYQAETTKSPAVTRNQQSEIPSNHTGRLENTIMVNQLVSQPQAANRPSMTPVNITSKSKKSESSSLNMAKGSSPPVSAKPPQKVTNPQMATGAPLPSSQEQVNVKQSYQNTVAVDTKVRGAETTTLEQRLQQSYPTTPTVPQLKSHNKSPKVSTKPVSRLKDIESSSPNTVKNSGPPPVAMKPAKQVNQNTEEIENKVFVSIPVDQHTSTPAVQTSSTRPITNATNAVKQMASQLNAGPIKTKQSPKVPVRRSSLSNEGSPKAVNPSQQLSQSYKQEQSVTSPTTKRPARKAPAPPKKQSSGSPPIVHKTQPTTTPALGTSPLQHTFAGTQQSNTFQQHTSPSQLPILDNTQPVTIDNTLSKTSLTTFGVTETVGYDYTEDQGWKPPEEAPPIVEHEDGLDSWSSSSTFGSTFGTTFGTTGQSPANSII